MTSEHDVRTEVCRHASASSVEIAEIIHEFWIPPFNIRADVAVISSEMHGYEIKTARDTLRRLPHQADSYDRIFDHCYAVVAENHLAATIDLLPDWWGIFAIQSRSLTVVREPSGNPMVDAATLVRLLWKDEARKALVRLGIELEPGATRGRLWQELLSTQSLNTVKAVVRESLQTRNPDHARIPSRRFAVS